MGKEILIQYLENKSIALTQILLPFLDLGLLKMIELEPYLNQYRNEGKILVQIDNDKTETVVKMLDDFGIKYTILN